MPRQIVGSSSTSRATAVGAPSNRPLSVRNGCAQSVLSRRKNNWPAANMAWRPLRVERADENRALVGLAGFWRLGREVDEMLSVGQDLRPAVACEGRALSGGDFDRRSALRGHLLQAAAHARREHDDVLRAPGSAAA